MLDKLGLENLLIPTNDEFFSEYIDEKNSIFYHFTKLQCSNGLAFVQSNGKNALFTDGRYTLIAKSSLPTWQISHLAQNSIIEFIKQANIDEICVISDYFSYNFVNNLSCHIKIKYISSSDIRRNFIPEAKNSQEIFHHEIKYAGEESSSKIAKVRNILKNPYFFSDPHSICWLLNIRGKEDPYTPVYNCFCLLTQDEIFVFSEKKVEIEIQNVQFLQYEDIENICNTYEIVNCDFNVINHQLYKKINNEKDKLCHLENPVIHLKSIKNDIQIKGFIDAHNEDALAVEKLINYAKNTDNITELDIVDKSIEFRKNSENFHSLSFATISGYNKNGAIIHYKANETSNLEIKKDGILLIDSGGQYFTGTTDITRTIAIGGPTKVFPKVKFHYTIVLKSLIMLSSLHFPYGYSGGQLDAIARYNIWQNGLDYNHGTGHGVGHFLSVHEGDCGISARSKPAFATKLEENMVLSIEPGLYFQNQYGIRLENLVYIAKSIKFDNFLQFNTLTKVQFDDNLIEYDLLTQNEKKWLMEYDEFCIN